MALKDEGEREGEEHHNKTERQNKNEPLKPEKESKQSRGRGERTTVERHENTSLAQPVGINRKHEQRQGKEGKCEEKGGKTENRERRQNKG